MIPEPKLTEEEQKTFDKIKRAYTTNLGKSLIYKFVTHGWLVNRKINLPPGVVIITTTGVNSCIDDNMVRAIGSKLSTDEILKICSSKGYRQFKEKLLNTHDVKPEDPRYAYFSLYTRGTYDYIFNLFTCFPEQDVIKDGVLQREAECGFIPSGLYELTDKESNKLYHYYFKDFKLMNEYAPQYVRNLATWKNTIIKTDYDIEVITQLLKWMFISETEGDKYIKHFLNKANDILKNYSQGLQTIVRLKDGNFHPLLEVSYHDLLWITLGDMIELNLIPNPSMLILQSCRGGYISEIEASLKSTEKIARDGPSMKHGSNGNPIICESVKCSEAIHSLEHGQDPDGICKLHGCFNCVDGKCTSCEDNNAILLNIDGRWFCFTIDEIYTYVLKHFNIKHYSKLPALPDDVEKLKTPVPELDITIPGYIVLVCIMIKYNDFSPVNHLTYYSEMKQYLNEKLDNLDDYVILNIFINRILKFYILPFVYIQKDTLRTYIIHTFREQILSSLISMIQNYFCTTEIPSNDFILSEIGGKSGFMQYFIENFFEIAEDSSLWVRQINNIIGYGSYLLEDDDSSDDVCEPQDVSSVIKNFKGVKLGK